jgi:hypothetical protein
LTGRREALPRDGELGYAEELQLGLAHRDVARQASQQRGDDVFVLRRETVQRQRGTEGHHGLARQRAMERGPHVAFAEEDELGRRA